MQLRWQVLLLVCSRIAGAQVPPLAGACETELAGKSGMCCWPGQKWSPFLEVCVGAPRCPEGMVTHGERCDEVCTGERVATADTDGHCCWPGQAWSHARQLCVGVPRCPLPLSAHGETCAPGCPRGQLATLDTAGRCCWPGQAWSTIDKRCRGVPYCPRGFEGRGEACAPSSRASLPWVEPPVQRRVLLSVIDASPQPDATLELRDDLGGTRACRPPCALLLPVGTTHIEGRGPLRFSEDLSLQGPATIEVHHSPCGRSCLVAGLVMLIAGGGTSFAGMLAAGYSYNLSDAGNGALAFLIGTISAVIGTVVLSQAGGDGLELVDDDRAARSERARP